MGVLLTTFLFADILFIYKKEYCVNNKQITNFSYQREKRLCTLKVIFSDYIPDFKLLKVQSLSQFYQVRLKEKITEITAFYW